MSTNRKGIPGWWWFVAVLSSIAALACEIIVDMLSSELLQGLKEKLGNNFKYYLLAASVFLIGFAVYHEIRKSRSDSAHSPSASPSPDRITVQIQELKGDLRIDIPRNKASWGLGALSIALVISAAILNIGPIQQLFPRSGPFESAKPGQSLVVVATFEDRTAGNFLKIDPAQDIFEELKADSVGLPIRIERLPEVVNDNTVRKAGESFGCTILVWGWYDQLALTPRIEQIRATNCRPSFGIRRFPLVDPDPKRLYVPITQDLPAHVRYLVFLILGLDRYGAFAYGDALKFLNKAIDAASTAPDGMASAALAARADTYRRMKNYHAAIADYNEVISHQPNNPTYIHNRALAYQDIGDSEHASQTVKQPSSYTLT